MLCAVAAEHLLKGQFKDLGAAPIWDPVQKIFREGYIVVPANRRKNEAGPATACGPASAFHSNLTRFSDGGSSSG